MNNKSIAKIKIIATVNGIAAVLHFIFWAFVFLKVPLEPSEKITAYGLGIADMLWSVPLLAIGSIALYKQRFIGFLAAQMANVLYWYSFTFILFREFNTHFRPGTFLFLPFALFSFWAAWYLWKVRSVFKTLKRISLLICAKEVD